MLKLYNDDCMNVLTRMEDNSVDLIITSPPYNLNHISRLHHNNEDTRLLVTYNSYSDDLSYEEYEKWQVKVLNELYRVLKPSGLLYYNHKERHIKGYYFNPLNLIQRSLFLPLQTIIWNRGGGVTFNNGRFVNSYETINVAYKSSKYMRVPTRHGKRFDVWNIPPTKNKCNVPEFPLELPLRIIRAYEDYDDLTVMDCFMGGGSVGVASLQEGRNFIGMEIDKETFDYAYQRTRSYQSKLI